MAATALPVTRRRRWARTALWSDCALEGGLQRARRLPATSLRRRRRRPCGRWPLAQPRPPPRSTPKRGPPAAGPPGAATRRPRRSRLLRLLRRRRRRQQPLLRRRRRRRRRRRQRLRARGRRLWCGALLPLCTMDGGRVGVQVQTRDNPELLAPSRVAVTAAVASRMAVAAFVATAAMMGGVGGGALPQDPTQFSRSPAVRRWRTRYSQAQALAHTYVDITQGGPAAFSKSSKPLSSVSRPLFLPSALPSALLPSGPLPPLTARPLTPNHPPSFLLPPSLPKSPLPYIPSPTFFPSPPPFSPIPPLFPSSPPPISQSSIALACRLTFVAGLFAPLLSLVHFPRHYFQHYIRC